MHGARYGTQSMMGLAMIVGIVAALTVQGVAAASTAPDRPAFGPLGIVAACGCGNGVALARDGDEPWPPPMSPKETQQTLDAYWAMLDSGSSVEEIVAEDAVLTYGDMGHTFQGRAAVTRALNDLYHVAFAGRMTRDSRIVGGGWAATSGTFVGTQIGSFEGMAPTGKSMAVPYTAVYTLASGQIVAIQLDFSQQDILSQLAGTTIPWSSAPARPGIPY